MAAYQKLKRLYLPFGDLLADLQRQGFKIGVQHHLHLHRLMQESEVFGKTELSVLKETLCPLFATNPEEQERFYITFDRHFAEAKPLKVKSGAAASSKTKQKAPIPTAEKVDVKAPSQQQFWLLGLAVLVVIAVGVFLYSEFLSPDSGSWPSITADATNPPPPPRNTYVDDSTASGGGTGLSATGGPLILLPHSYLDPNIELLEIPNPWWHEYQAFVNWWILLCVVGLVLLYEYYLFARKKAVLSQRSAMQPGERKDLNIFQKVKTSGFEAFYASLGVLRKRVLTSRLSLDIPATVEATARMGGWLDLRFDHDSKPAEYLILTERQSPNDQLTRLFEVMAQQLADQGLHVELFYYENEPTSFVHPFFNEPVSLKKLQYHYGDHRLLVMGAQWDWVNQSGQLSSAAEALKAWPEAAFFSALPTSAWTQPEEVLAERFAFFPLTNDGWAAYPQFLETGSKPLFDSWVRQGLGFVGGKDASGDLSSLATYLGDAGDAENGYTLLDWWAACCHYPRLEWRLTMLLGKALQHPKSPLLSWERMAQLLTLPWFRSGQIPDDLREQALKDKRFTQNGSRKIALTTLKEALEDNFDPGNNSIPQLENELSWLVTSIQLSNDNTQKRKWRQRAGLLRESLERGDRIFLSLSSLPRFGWDLFARNENLRNRLFMGGQSYKGLNPIARLVLALVMVALPLMLLDLEVRSCRPLHFVYQSHSYCPNTPQKEATFRTHRAAFYHNSRPLELENPPAHHNLSRALTADPGYPPALINLFIRKYNRGIIQFHSRDMNNRFEDALKTWEENQASVADIRQALNQGVVDRQQEIDQLRVRRIEEEDQVELLESILEDLRDYQQTFEKVATDNDHAIGLAQLQGGDRKAAVATYRTLPPDYFENRSTPHLQSMLQRAGLVR